MILYNEDNTEKVAYIRCECMTHGIEISKLKFDEPNIPSDIIITMYTDNFYGEQKENFFKRWKDKFVKIFYILRGKAYRIESDIVLSETDLEELIEVLKKIKEENKNEN